MKPLLLSILLLCTSCAQYEGVDSNGNPFKINTLFKTYKLGEFESNVAHAKVKLTPISTEAEVGSD